MTLTPGTLNAIEAWKILDDSDDLWIEVFIHAGVKTVRLCTGPTYAMLEAPTLLEAVMKLQGLL